MDKPTVNLVGEDGNAFFILGKVKKALRKFGCSNEYIDNYITDATSSDYNHLIQTTMEYVNVK